MKPRLRAEMTTLERLVALRKDVDEDYRLNARYTARHESDPKTPKEARDVALACAYQGVAVQLLLLLDTLIEAQPGHRKRPETHRCWRRPVVVAPKNRKGV